MDLVAARRDGIDFFSHKGTEGTRFIHEQCGEALNRARAAGIPFLGAYMVPRTPGNGGNGTIPEQVAYFLSNVTRMVPWWPLHPGWFWQMDTEHWYSSSGVAYDAVSPAVGAQAAQMLAQQTGRKVLHYAPKWSYGDNVPGSEPLWASVYPAADAVHYRERYAEVHGDSGIGWASYSGRAPAIWQYSSAVTIGSQPRCDGNAFRGTLNDFAAMIGAPKDPPSAAQRLDEENEMKGMLPVGFAYDENGYLLDPRLTVQVAFEDVNAVLGNVVASFSSDHIGRELHVRFATGSNGGGPVVYQNGKMVIGPGQQRTYQDVTDGHTWAGIGRRKTSATPAPITITLPGGGTLDVPEAEWPIAWSLERYPK